MRGYQITRPFGQGAVLIAYTWRPGGRVSHACRESSLSSACPENMGNAAGGYHTLSTTVIVRYSRGAVDKPDTKFDEEHLRQFLGSLRTVSNHR